MNEYRTHNCGELRIHHVGTQVTLSGWVQGVRNKGTLLWIDLRDRFGITQVFLHRNHTSAELLEKAQSLGREYVLQVSGTVIKREAENPKMETGQVEVVPTSLTILNAAKLPPFLIEDETDGGEDLRMKYRYLDLRRSPMRNNLLLRHALKTKVHEFLNAQQFVEVETPVLIKSTPEGARDFVVPSRMNQGSFYALPQSPQTFKQLLMVAGLDRYYQIVKCFRDESLRSDRQPEFTQIDCELSFVTQEDILNIFEGMMQYIFKEVNNVDLGTLPRMTYEHAMRYYGNDKPDIRFELLIEELNKPEVASFAALENAESILSITIDSAASQWTTKDLKALQDWAKQYSPSVMLSYARGTTEGVSSPLSKFYHFELAEGVVKLIVAGTDAEARKTVSELRLRVAEQLGLRDPSKYAALWVTDFPLLEWDEEQQRWSAMHHPFTSPHVDDIALLNTDPGKVRANAYDMVINGTEVGGGSIRIHERGMQERMFKVLGFTEESAKAQFGFLLDAFEYGAPPHGGLAFGFDRLCALLGGHDSIREVIAFPKNNHGRDTMLDAPAPIEQKQLDELRIKHQ